MAMAVRRGQRDQGGEAGEGDALAKWCGLLKASGRRP